MWVIEVLSKKDYLINLMILLYEFNHKNGNDEDDNGDGDD